MLRILNVKFHKKGLAVISNHGSSRFCCATRFYARDFSTGQNPPRPPRKSGRGLLLTFGTLSLITGATVAYAKYDPQFRTLLKDNVPYSDDFIRFILQEEISYQDQIEKKYKAAEDKVKSLIFGESSVEPKKALPLPPSKSVTQQKVETTPPQTPQKPTHMNILAEKPSKSVPEPKQKEIKVTESSKVEKLAGKPIRKSDTGPPAEKPKTLAELEEKIMVAAAKAIESYERAASYLSDYNAEVHKIVESSIENLQDKKLWQTLKEKTEIKDKALKEAEVKAEAALTHLEKMKAYLDEFGQEVDISTLAAVRQTTENMSQNLVKSVQRLESAKRESSLADKYWRKVEDSRKYFTDELEILFPSLRIAERNLKVSEDQLDLFVHLAYQRILWYQKELHKLETLGQEKLRKAVGSLGKDSISEAQIDMEVAKERRNLIANFEKEILKIRAESERELRKQLKLQTEVHDDHIADLMKLKEDQKDRESLRMLDEKLTQEQMKYKKQMAAMIGRLKGLETALKERAVNEKNARDCQMLWGACQSLLTALRTVKPNVSWKDQLRPLTEEIKCITAVVSPEDKLVTSVISAIPQEAMTRGVYPESALRERFLKVERVARRLTLVPEGGAALPVYLLSYLQSFLLIKSINSIPSSELANEPIDISKLDTYDILQRARYWLDRGDFEQTLKYMNLLRGAPRSIAHDWMNETRIMLETRQAATVLITHASANGLAYL